MKKSGSLMNDVRKLAGNALRGATKSTSRPELREPRNVGRGEKKVQYLPRKDS